jgi:hypothetical protein
MLVLVGALVVLFVVAVYLSESRRMQGWRARRGYWYGGADASDASFGDLGDSGGDFSGGGD